MTKIQLWISKFVNPIAKFFYSVVGIRIVFDNEKARRNFITKDKETLYCSFLAKGRVGH